MRLFTIPENFEALTDDELRAFIDEASATIAKAAAAPQEFTSDEFGVAEFMDEITAGTAAIEEARDVLASRSAELTETDETDETETETETETEVEDTASVTELAELASRAAAAASDAAEIVTGEVEETALKVETEVEVDETETTAVVAAGGTTTVTKPRRARLARRRSATPAPVEEPRIALTAAAEGFGVGLGSPFPGSPEEQAIAIARAMIKRRELFGHIPEGTHGEKVPIAHAEWLDRYASERVLSRDDPARNWNLIEAVTASAGFAAEFARRRALDGDEALLASGGLCAPVTPYYGLQQLATADRPVRAALATFAADRGGINFATPAALSDITTAVGIKTAAQDAAGGSSATKSIQTIDCPPFQEVVIQAITARLRFGNFTARTFPELIAQWQELVAAMHARTAETALLDGIHTASTKVDGAGLGLGASATLLNQFIVAADGIRSRNRMRPDAVLRLLTPWWVLDLLVSDVYRSQFDRFDMSPEQFVGLLRQHNIEPSFYLDSASGQNQVWAAQAGGVGVIPFPTNVVSYIYPEGSYLFLDGGTLDLGLIRDSVLNATNDVEFFMETFENVAFTGIESLALTSNTCDSGTVSLPHAVACPIDYNL